ncbi:alpha/beta hydrolase [Amycolatopsis anabasis]|uniref:alpha/beta hydrolase n=1 Tax=Amycolatopsis anabasis TaxID=1840409 RepID=UPI00131EA275|nr:alpha/beta hydrolase-fold protein [Amycolatopsis anabasis]
MTELTVLAEEVTGDRVRELRLHSPALGRDVSVNLLTPPGWRPDREYPVLYLLHGSSDDHRCWLTHTDLAALSSASQTLIVMPDGGRMGFYTDWRVPDRQGTVPGWETFHLTELLPLLENRYGASDRRMVAGISMGGYGALRYGMRHPGMFRAVASLSGLMHLTRRGMGGLLGLLSVREGMRPGRVWGPRRYGLDTWAANDPFRFPEAFAGTPVYLAAGDGTRVPGEEFVAGMGLVERYARAMSADLAERLTAHGVDVTTNFSPGIHFWTTWRRKLAELWPYTQRILSG